MDWQIVFSPAALQDLAEIVEFIAKDDPEVAERVGHELIDRAQILQSSQRQGSPIRAAQVYASCSRGHT